MSELCWYLPAVLYFTAVREHGELHSVWRILPAVRVFTVKWLLEHPDKHFSIPVQFSDALQTGHHLSFIRKPFRDEGKEVQTKLNEKSS